MQMDIDQYGNPWIVSENNKLYAVIAGKLTLIPGKVYKVAIQKNSTKAAIYALREAPDDNGYSIHKLNVRNFTWD
jgi:hypothetical protein